MNKDKYIMYGFMLVFTCLVFILSFDIQVKLNNNKEIKDKKIKGQVVLVSKSKSSEYMANTKVVKGTSALVLNETLTSEDLKKITEEESLHVLHQSAPAVLIW